MRRHDSAEAMNIIKALEEYKHESKGSEHTINEESNWARKPALRRKERKRLEEMIPSRQQVIEALVKKSQVYSKINE